MTGPARGTEEGPLDDVVAGQYQRWRYPEPITNLDGWLASNWEWFDPSHAYRTLWPERDQYRPDLEILVAGCGTNQAAVFAYTNPGAHVIGIDVSQTSLDHQKHLKDTYGLWNLDLYRLPIEEVLAVGQDFDLVVSTGVLHHLVDPVAGLAALGSCLRPDGVAAIMVYARYGRIGVELLEGVFRDLGLSQDEPSLRLVKDALAGLPDTHPVHAYLEGAGDARVDAGLVDTFLHGRERSYTTGDCVDLVAAAGLTFAGWFLRAPYYPHELINSGSKFRAAIAGLPEPLRWSVMERIHTGNGRHFFLARPSAQPPASYTVAFDTDAALDYTPHLRAHCGLDRAGIYRPDWRLDLNAAQLPLVQRVDDHATIREIVAAAAEGGPRRAHDSEVETFARTLFQALWRLDFLDVTTSAT